MNPVRCLGKFRGRVLDDALPRPWLDQPAVNAGSSLLIVPSHKMSRTTVPVLYSQPPQAHCSRTSSLRLHEIMRFCISILFVLATIVSSRQPSHGIGGDHTVKFLSLQPVCFSPIVTQVWDQNAHHFLTSLYDTAVSGTFDYDPEIGASFSSRGFSKR